MRNGGATARPPLAAIPGVAEALLSAATAAALPATAPPAPWTLRLDGVLWLHAPARSAGAWDRPGAPLTLRLRIAVGGFIRYHDSPVGPYTEVWGSPALLLGRHGPAVQVPFMAVDSLASLHAGRTTWALPKCLATFRCERTAGRAPTFGATGTDAAWSVGADVVATGAPVPLLAAAQLLQSTGDGQSRMTRVRAHGRGRLARLDVASSGPSLPAWLVTGRHLGVVIEHATLVIGVPRDLAEFGARPAE